MNFRIFLLIVYIFLMQEPVDSTVATWNLNANGNWNVNGNWTPTTFPNATDDTANFLNIITATRTVTLGQNITVGTMSFDSNSSYLISGANTLSFKVASGNAQINLTNVNGNGADTISSPILLNNNLVMNHSSPSNFTISGIISDGGGGLGLTKAGSGLGALVLNAANTYTGNTNINDGRLTYNVNGAIRAGNAVNIGDGSGAAGSAILNMVPAMTQVNAFSVALSSDGLLIQNSGATTYLTSLQGSGAISLSTATATTNLFNLTQSGNTTFSGVMSGGVANASLDPAVGNRFLKAGTGTLTLTAASTQASRIFIAEGIIDITNSSALGASGVNSGTFIQGGTTTTGSLYLENNISCPKRILLNGSGVGGAGALRNVSGNNTITGNVQVGWAGGTENASDATIQVDSGSILTLNGILQGTKNLIKTNPGTLLLNGVSSNTLSGSININDGMIQLNKTAGLNAIAGNVQVNAPGILRLLNTNQIANTSVVNLNGGTFDLNGNTETIGSLVFNSGTLNQTGGIVLGLNNATPTALSMSDNTTILGPITFTSTGGVTYNGSTTRASVNGALNLGTFAHNFDIATSLDIVGMDISGIISGTGSINKITSAGVLQFSGTTANTYTGNTTISAGKLLLNKSPGINAIAGNVTINGGGTLMLATSEQLVNSSIVTLSGGIFDLNSQPETIGRLVFNSGNLSQGGAALSLSSNLGTALSMGNGTFIAGPIVFTNTGGVTYSGATTRATVSGAINLGTVAHNFNIAAGADSIDMDISGVISGTGSISKITGSGLLQFSGVAANTYTGLTTVSAGELLLNKTAGVNAIAGNVTINSGGTLSLGASDQIVNTAVMTLAGGTFNLAGFNETITQLTFTSGTLNQAGSTLTLSSNTTALSLGNGVTIPGNINLTGSGAIVYTGTTTTSTIGGVLDLGVSTHTFNIGNGTATPDLDITNVISSSGGGITKTGLGRLSFSGASPNTYSGLTTVSAGELFLNKTAGINAIGGNVTLNAGGTLSLGASDQIVNTAVMTLAGGTFNMAGFNETIGQLTFTSGTLNQAGSTLTLSSNTTALSLGNGVTIPGNINLTGSGAIVYTGTTTTSTIGGVLDLGVSTHTFNIGNGTATPDLDITNVISSSGGGITKTGLGRLSFSGASPNTYSGLTTVSAGELFLNKTAGINAIGGNVTLNAGGTLSLGASDQIVNTAVMTLAGGTFNMAGFNETIGQLTFTTGTLNQGGALLSLSSNATALSLGNGLTISGNVSLTGSGDVLYTGTTATSTISGLLDLGTSTHNFNIANGTATPDLQITNVISGSGGGITKIGAGRLAFSGASPNTYSGLTTVSAGELFLNKTAGVNAIAGDASITGGTLILGTSSQIIDTSVVTLAGGTFNMAGFSETIGQLTFNSGTLNQGGALLSLSSNTTALSLGNGLTISGNVNLIGSGDVVYTGTTATSTISGLLDLGASTHNFNIGNGTATSDLQITNVISGSGGGITKTGAGRLTLSGASPNTYSGLTTVSAGELFLSKTAGVNGVTGNVLISGGTLILGASEQIPNTATITQSSGVFNLAGFNETLSAYLLNGGTYSSGAGVLSLTSNTTAFSLGDGVISAGNVNLTGSGDLVYTGTTSTATVSGPLNLGASTHNFNIANGIATPDLQITSVISSSGGGVTKTGPGRLAFSGASPNTYSGLTTVSAGELFLNKTAGLNGVTGNVSIAGGTLILGASEQIPNTATVTQSSGLFDLAGFNETLSSYILNGGTYSSGAGVLSLTSNTTILSLGDGVTLAGNVNLTGSGDVVYTGTTATSIISGLLDLGASSHNFNIANGTATPDLDITNVISSAGGGITKTGAGRLAFSGALPNTYSGLTTVSAGELFLNKTAGVNGVTGNVSIAGGTLILGASEQIPNTATVTQSSGLFDLAGFNETLSSYILNGGTYSSGAGVLSLTSNTTALSLGDGVTLAGNVNLTGSGDVVYTGTTATSIISGLLDLGASSHNFNIANGTATPDLDITNVISSAGGGITKTGAGRLAFSGTSPNTYSGLTTVSAGELFLNKTAGVNAIAGDVSITGGTLILGTSEQIADTSTLTQSSGILSLAGFNETIEAYIFNGGTYSPGAGVLSLTSNTTALSLGHGVTLVGNINLTGSGAVEYTGTTSTSTISGLLDLGTFTHDFNIADGTGTPDLDITNAISSSGGGITKTGAGRLAFSGASPNTYSGLTTVSAGELFLNKTAGVNAIAGDVSITGGTLILGASEQIADTSTLTQSSGILDFAGFNETIEAYIFNGGIYVPGGSILNLVGAGTALSMRDTMISGNLVMVNGGSIAFDNTNNGTAVISGDIDLNGLTTSFDITNGLGNPDMLVSGTISNGGIVKNGLGLLQLTGMNTYSSGTLINNGTLLGSSISLQGDIVDNANLIFDQTFNGTYAGILSGMGSMTKQGAGELIYTNTASFSGLTTVTEGSFTVNGTYGGGGTLITNSGTFLSGTGTIGQNSTIYGTLSPGNGIGPLYFIGNQTFATGSMVDIELNSFTNDLIDINGTLVIQPGVTLNVEPNPGNYATPETHLIVKTTGGISGEFSTVTSSLPLFSPVLVYTPNELYLQGLFAPFSQVFPCGNAGAVAHCLDSINPSPKNDLGFVINQLRLLPTLDAIKDGLLQLQPSALTSLAVAQDNNFFYVKNAVYYRLDQLFYSCFERNNYGFCTWITPLLGSTHQKNRDEEPGFKAQTTGIVGGVDFELSDFILGLNFGYNHTHLAWHKNRGDVSLDSIYGGFYGRWRRGYCSIEGIIDGNYGAYHLKRHIKFGKIDRKARGSTCETSVAGSIKGSLSYDMGMMVFSPFVRTDYIYSRRGQLKESGAKSLNLTVESNHFQLFTGECGIELFRCNSFSCVGDEFWNCNVWKPFLELSILYENRLSGTHEKALLCNSCPMKVTGLYPSRALGTFTLGFDMSNRAKHFFSIYYKGRYSDKFEDHSIYLNFIF